MKECKKCLKTLGYNQFYKHKEMADGHLSFCKKCVKSRVLKHREDNVEKIREYDRLRSKDKKSIVRRVLTTKKWRFKHPKARRAQGAVARAKKSGMLKILPCEVCGSEKVHAHHPDYNKPLDVMWLCSIHHKEWHKKNETIH